jgi:hypothetical protein
MTMVIATAVRRSLLRLDRVLLACLAILAGLAVIAPDQALASLKFTLSSLLYIAPFLVLAVAIAAYSGAAGVDRLIARAFSGRVLVMVLAAAAFGALSPFCSCGVIPIVGALLAMGMPLPAVMAFWLASPIMDPEMFVLTAATLGVPFATAKTLAAIGIGLLGGFTVMVLQRGGLFAAPLKRQASGCGRSALEGPQEVRWAFWQEEERRTRFTAAATSNLFFLGKWLALAFLLESVMLAYLPAEAVGQWLGFDNPFAVPLAALIGAPAYLNGYAAIPTAAALMDLGMTQGAALAFMTAGAVTSLPAAIAVYALVRLPVFIVYLALGFLGSTLAGSLYQASF